MQVDNLFEHLFKILSCYPQGDLLTAINEIYYLISRQTKLYSNSGEIDANS